MADELTKIEEGQVSSQDDPQAKKATVTVARAISPKEGRPFSLRNIISLFIGFVWLGPTLALFVLNFKEYIIGAGIGCHGLECRIDPYSTNQVQQTQALDKKNHDILGALQFVAKALEIWFMFIAGNLVFNIALRLAKKDLLPLSLLTTYAEFLDVLYLKSLIIILVDIIKEKNSADNGIPAAPAPSSIIMPNRTQNIAAVINATEAPGETAEPSSKPRDSKRQHLILYAFIFLVAFLSMVANLMGTATAILVLPALNWIDINTNDNVAFMGLKSSEPPRDESISPTCTVEQLNNGEYECSRDMYAASLDGFMDMSVSSTYQDINRKANAIPPLMQEGNVTATLNISESSRTIWVPTRQTMRDFSTDLNDYYSTTTFNSTIDPRYPDSIRFNQALQSRLQRKGPIVGMANDCVRVLRRNITSHSVSDGKDVLCFPRANDVKCIRWGPGWDSATQNNASFIIKSAINLTVSIWSTDQASYLSGDTVTNCGETDCDWDALLSAPPAPENLNISRSSLTFEYSFPDENANMKILCHTTSYLSFANYILNPSPLSNILSLIELNVLDDSPSSAPDNDISPIASVHPDWLLLAWSVDRTNGILPEDRAANLQLINASQTWLSGTDDSDSEAAGNRRLARNFNSLHQYTIVQALSMMTYNTSMLEDSASYAAELDALPATEKRTKAILSSYASVQLWKYGLDSRTSKLGVTIMMIGCLCVLARLVIYYDESKSPTEIVVTALEHPTPQATFDKRTGAPLRVSYMERPGHSRTISFGSPAASPAPTPAVSP